jgi:serine/threonine-protein kinase
MNAERYQQIEELFYAALEHKPEKRAAFIEQACGGDEELLREVKSLMAYDGRAGSFIETPPADVAALLARERDHSLLGHKLGHYQILSHLATGGMGEVYLAEDTKLARKVAIKLLPPESISDERAKRRLIKEAQAAASLDHPNICAIYEVGEENGDSFIVMQYVAGQTLSDRIKNRPLPPAEIVDIAVQIVDALREAHSRGIIHRDIKPQNIMVTSREQVKVMDFGLATVVPTVMNESDSVVTEPGMIMGTVPYMSPEQVKGDAIDARSDIFSFGTVMYEIISGRQPFAAPSAAETISKILREDPPPLPTYRTDVPEELQQVVHKCLEKEKERRYQSTSELLADLRRIKKDIDLGLSTNRVVSKPRAGRKWGYPAAVAATLSLAAIGYYLFFGMGKPARREIHSIAVLPFVNDSADSNAEYLSDGITESLINSFSQLSQLKVIARTTAFRYKGKDMDPQALGSELRVDAIVTGRVRQQGDTLIVQADLLSAADGTEIWGAKHSRKLSDIFAVEELIAQEIAEKLRIRLTGTGRQELSKRYSETFSAYQNYLLGFSNLQRRTHNDLVRSIGYFEKAIEAAPNYAPAYAALTEVYVSLTIRGLIAPDEGRRKAVEAARKALSLDPNLPEALTAIGETHVFFAPFDFRTGDQELRRAIELSPSWVIAYQVLGASLLEQGRLEEALAVIVKAREIDPLSPIIARLEAITYLFKRDYARSLELLRQSYELGPSFTMWSEIEIYINSGVLDKAQTEMEKAKLERHNDPFLIYTEGIIAAARGRREDALRIIKKLEEISGMSLHRAMWIAMIYAALDEKDLALSLLERGLEAGAIALFYKDAPGWDTIRSDHRFTDLLRRMGIPE